MNRRTLTYLSLLAILALAAPVAAAREGESGGGHGGDDATQTGGGGTDDPANHDAGDDHGGGDDDGPGHDAGDDHGGNHGGSGSGSGGGSWQRARQDLLRDADSPDADATGHVEVRVRGDRQRFSVEVEHLDAGAAVEVLVEDGSGSMATAGSLVADATGEAELESDTGDGGVLPAGATAVADLAGRRVEVRDGSGNLLLEGTVPSIDGVSANARAKETVKDPDTGLRVRVEFKVEGKKGRQRVRVEVKGLPAGAAAELWIADAAGTLVKAADLGDAGGRKVRVRLDTRKGDALFLGVLDLADLSGRAFEVRADGVTLASGNLPVL